MKPANSVLIRSSDTESAGPTAPQCRESLFYLFCLSTLTGADQFLMMPFPWRSVAQHRMLWLSSLSLWMPWKNYLTPIFTVYTRFAPTKPHFHVQRWMFLPFFEFGTSKNRLIRKFQKIRQSTNFLEHFFMAWYGYFDRMREADCIFPLAVVHSPDVSIQRRLQYPEFFPIHWKSKKPSVAKRTITDR